MIDLAYSLVIEATADTEFFSFYSPELEGFTGSGWSIEDCLVQARAGIREHVALLQERGLPVPPSNPDPIVTVKNHQSELTPQ
jgi:predicted RNase H-like HicB family nuclease